MSALERRKHRRQMQLAEITSVETVVHAQECWIGDGPHVTKRARSKRVDGSDIYHTLKTGEVIEVNDTNDLCILMRKKFGHYAVCVVVNLPTRWIVTSWKNQLHDNHSKLDMSKYRWDVNLCNVMAPFLVDTLASEERNQCHSLRSPRSTRPSRHPSPPTQC